MEAATMGGQAISRVPSARNLTKDACRCSMFMYVYKLINSNNLIKTPLPMRAQTNRHEENKLSFSMLKIGIVLFLKILIL